ncbi:hypothetical protein P43SY_002688 [Pythium insidiosum]|uniref:Cytidyltransferase-like domain-containing protein n=1 Tax=Pythium insidiosum TaxID=114742 RepID=A0AAD5LR90_PYTIN|nr:hypothetical protein P43SY_002688 [Pythium insidiosum]
MSGHMGAVAFCRDLYDEIWVLPVYQHIYSSKRQLAPFHHRVKMTELAVADMDRMRQDTGEGSTRKAIVRVSEAERELFEYLAARTDKPEDLRVGSIDLVRFLREKYPAISFTMLLGADTFADLRAGKWKNGDELQQLVKLLVMSRKGYEPPAIELSDEERQRIGFITIPTLDNASSTRTRAIDDPIELGRAVLPSVADYIIENKLYAFASSQ